MFLDRAGRARLQRLLHADTPLGQRYARTSWEKDRQTVFGPLTGRQRAAVAALRDRFRGGLDRYVVVDLRADAHGAHPVAFRPPAHPGDGKGLR